MPFPLTITTDPDWSSEISANSGVLGPFEIGGLFYVLLEHVSNGCSRYVAIDGCDGFSVEPSRR